MMWQWKRIYRGMSTIEVLTQSLTLDVDMNYDIFAVGTLAQDNLSLLAVH